MSAKRQIKNKMKMVVVAAGLACASLLGAIPAAHAWEDGDPVFLEWEGSDWYYFRYSTYTDFVTEVDNQFYAINTYMAEIYAYMNAGEGETGTGIIGTMNKIWQEQQQFTESTNKNSQQMNRVTNTDAAVSHRVAAAMPDARECSEIPRVMGARMAGGGGGASRASKGQIEKVVGNNSAGTATNTVTQAGDVYGTHAQQKYCSTADVKFTNGSAHSAFGCSAASTSMPDGDARVQSLFVPAHDFTDSAKAKAANLTFTSGDQGQASADAAKNIIASFSPVGLSTDAETTPEGKQYLAKVKIFNARISPAVNALAQIAAMRFPDATLPDFLSTGWTTLAQPVYTNIFPGQTVPTQPSQAEVMRFEVLRRFADFGSASWHQQIIKDDDQANLLRELNYTEAVNGYVLWQMNNRIEEGNAVNAAILAQLVNPVSKEDMDKASRAVYSNKK